MKEWRGRTSITGGNREEAWDRSMAHARWGLVLLLLLPLAVQGREPVPCSDATASATLTRTVYLLSVADDTVRFQASCLGGAPHPPNPMNDPFRPIPIGEVWTIDPNKALVGYFPPNYGKYLLRANDIYNIYQRIFRFKDDFIDPFSPNRKPFRYATYKGLQDPYWDVWSIGPDAKWDIQVDDKGKVVDGWYPNSLYDPTNGVCSSGDIVCQMGEMNWTTDVTKRLDAFFEDPAASRASLPTVTPPKPTKSTKEKP